MSALRLVSIGSLRRRLATALAPSDPLWQALEHALERQDEALLGEAMGRLRSAPPAARERVEAVILDWLLDGADPIALAELPAANAYRH